MATTAQWGEFEWGEAEWGSVEEDQLALEAAVRIPIEWGGTLELIRATHIEIEATATVEGSPRIQVEAIGTIATVTALQIESLAGVGNAAALVPIEWQAALLVTADPRIPIEVKATIEAAPRIPFESGGVILLEANANLPIETLGQVIGRALLQLEVSGRDDTVLAYVWKVLAPADAVQAYQWLVLPEIVVGAEQGYTWRVVEDSAAQGYSWTVIPAALLELFESQGAGAAVGIAPDTLLPVGRATKD